MIWVSVILFRYLAQIFQEIHTDVSKTGILLQNSNGCKQGQIQVVSKPYSCVGCRGLVSKYKPGHHKRICNQREKPLHKFVHTMQTQKPDILWPCPDG